MPAGIIIILALEEAIIREKYDVQLRDILHRGEIETAINTQVAHGRLGNGLTEARTNLSKLKQKKIRFSVTLDNQWQQVLFADAFIAYQNITEKWDVNNDYQIASAFIQLKDYKEVARELNRTKSLMWKEQKRFTWMLILPSNKPFKQSHRNRKTLLISFPLFQPIPLYFNFISNLFPLFQPISTLFPHNFYLYSKRLNPNTYDTLFILSHFWLSIFLPHACCNSILYHLPMGIQIHSTQARTQLFA